MWDGVVGPVLEAIQGELNRMVRGGPVFALVVEAWKRGESLGSNKVLAGRLGWDFGEVAEGFRLVREKLKAWQDPVLEVRVKEYTRELVVTARGGVRPSGDVLLSVGGDRPEIAGRALAGASPVFKNRGMRLICEQPANVEEQARVLDPAGYAGFLVLPVDETDDFRAIARLGSVSGKVALLDISTRNSSLPCVSFDYTGAGLYCAQALLEIGCTDIVVISRENDSRTFAVSEGYRRAVRGAERNVHRLFTVDESIGDLIGRLQEKKLLGRTEGKLGIVCADGELGEGLLRYLDAVKAGSWEVAVAVVGGDRWAAQHWVDLIWAELDYAELAAAGARYLLGAQGATVPQVKPKYERWIPRKSAGVATEVDQQIWRPVKAG